MLAPGSLQEINSQGQIKSKSQNKTNQGTASLKLAQAKQSELQISLDLD
jgi:hypothetical protein